MQNQQQTTTIYPYHMEIEAGMLIRREIRKRLHVMRMAHTNIRWFEDWGMLSSDFIIYGEERVMRLLKDWVGSL